MDLVVRRQSEQLDRHFAEAPDDDVDKMSSCDVYDHRKWEWGHLRVITIHYKECPRNLPLKITSLQTECLNLGLETFYRTYVQRLQRSYLSVFFVMHTLIGVVHTIVLVATQTVYLI